MHFKIISKYADGYKKLGNNIKIILQSSSGWNAMLLNNIQKKRKSYHQCCIGGCTYFA
jgi:hypothetical protein